MSFSSAEEIKAVIHCLAAGIVHFVDKMGATGRFQNKLH
jgi:hypothetical protein